MGSEEMNLVSSQRMETALNSQRVYQAEHLQYRCPPSAVNQRRGGPDSARKTARPVGVGGFVESGGRFLPQQRDFRGGIYNPDDLDSDSRRGGSVNMNVNMSMNMNMNMNSNTGGLQMRGLVGRNARTANQQDWNERVAVMGGEGSAGSPSEDDDDDDEDDDDGDGEMDGEVDGMVSNETANTNSNSNNATSNNNVQGTLEGGFQKGEGGIPKSGMQNQHHTSLGMFLSPPFLNSFPSSGASMLDGSSAAQNGGAFYRDGLVKESRDNNNSTAANTASSLHEHHQPRIPSMHHNEGALPVGSVPDTDNYYTQLLQSTPPLAHKDAGVDEGGALAEKKGTVAGTESPETSLRTILSDPFTGALMDDATILSCGHSFGSAGLQQVLDMRSCLSCGQQVTNDSVAPNHALRAAVQAYRREEEFQSMSSKSAKRRRDKFEQGLDKVGFSDTVLMDCSRGKGVQFPFVVNDRVVIKGNKRTPERFVGREAVITTQCLNGWYVVKTLDNAESVKLQYRSLLKVGEHQSSNEISQKALGPSWL